MNFILSLSSLTLCDANKKISGLEALYLARLLRYWYGAESFRAFLYLRLVREIYEKIVVRQSKVNINISRSLNPIFLRIIEMC